MKRSDITTIQVLKACHKFHNGGDTSPFTLLIEQTGAPEKVVYRAIEREVSKGNIEKARSDYLIPERFRY